MEKDWHLTCADDIAIIAKNNEALKQIILELNEESKRIDLNMLFMAL